MSNLDLRWLELRRGRHPRPEVGLCVLEAVSAYKGLSHSDMPPILPPGICHIVQVLNDAASSDKELTELWKYSVALLADFDEKFDEIDFYEAFEKAAVSMSDWGLEELDTSAAWKMFKTSSIFTEKVVMLDVRGKIIADWIEQSCMHSDAGRDVYLACCEVFRSCLNKT